MSFTRFATSEPFDPASGERLNKLGDELQEQINDCLKKVISMPHGTNVNQCGETGIYKCADWVNRPSNAPDNQGTLIVINYAGQGGTGAGTWLQQEFIEPHGDRRWIRACVNGNHTEWKEIATTEKTVVALSNGFVPTNPGQDELTIARTGNLVLITGQISNPSIIKPGTVICSLPAWARPSVLRRCFVFSGSGQFCGVDVDRTAFVYYGAEVTNATLRINLTYDV